MQLFLKIISELAKSVDCNQTADHEQSDLCGRWLGVAKVSCILRHWGIKLILAYSWASPAILVAGKSRGGCFYFFCFFTFILVLFLPCPSLSSPLLSLLSLFSLSLGDDTKWPTRVDVLLNPNTINLIKICTICI